MVQHIKTVFAQYNGPYL